MGAGLGSGPVLLGEVPTGSAVGLKLQQCGAGALRWLPRWRSQTTSHTAVTIVTIKKLGGALNIAEAISPSQTQATASPVEIAIASTGRGVSAIAVAAGVITSANSSSVPTAWMAIVTVSASSTMKTSESAPTGMPLAWATAELIEL